MNRKLSLVVIGVAVTVMLIVGIFRVARRYRRHSYVAVTVVHMLLPHMPSTQEIFDDYRDKDEEEAQTERTIILSYVISGNKLVS